MKRYSQFFTLIIGLLFLSSCGSIRVTSDYDTKTSFDQYKTFAFFKSGIDKAEINDIDKKRILRAIDSEMEVKGFLKSDNPDLLISIFTEAKERVNVNNNNFGFGLGFGGGFFNGGFGNSVSTTTEGVLFIDFIDAKNMELIWQGQGSGHLVEDTQKKQERITKFVHEILKVYPPEKNNTV